MNKSLIVILFLILTGSASLQGQDNGSADDTYESDKKVIYGFIRGGLYGNIDDKDDKPFISSGFSDFALKAEIKDDVRFRAIADIRFRYGTEFLESVRRIDLREAWVTMNGKIWDISAGQKIIKWGRTDFSNPTSKLNPQNYISRSPDPADMDMGNLLIDAKIYPLPFFSLEAVAIPYYRPSVLLIDPLPLPDWVNINQLNSLVTDKKMFTYGLRWQFHLAGIDMSISWFDGYDPMPGTALTSFNLDMSGSIPVPYAELTMKQYKLRNLGFDFETTTGSIGMRGEAAWSFPYKSWETSEYVPCEEIKYVAGIDWMPGNWRFTAEYSGKTIIDFEAPIADPFIGTEPDLAKLAIVISDPMGFDLNEYVRQQVSSFNRLYNYQLEKTYHSAGLRIERDLLYGKLVPSVFVLYNFTSKDFLMMPELKYKPADGLTICAGGDFYKGKKGSIHDLVDEFMNCFRIAIRVDF